jgi:hypothetical protein
MRFIESDQDVPIPTLSAPRTGHRSSIMELGNFITSLVTSRKKNVPSESSPPSDLEGYSFGDKKKTCNSLFRKSFETKEEEVTGTKQVTQFITGRFRSRCPKDKDDDELVDLSDVGSDSDLIMERHNSLAESETNTSRNNSICEDEIVPMPTRRSRVTIPCTMEELETFKF